MIFAFFEEIDGSLGALNVLAPVVKTDSFSAVARERALLGLARPILEGVKGMEAAAVRQSAKPVVRSQFCEQSGRICRDDAMLL
jgi:hypothetical protein